MQCKTCLKEFTMDSSMNTHKCNLTKHSDNGRFGEKVKKALKIIIVCQQVFENPKMLKAFKLV